MKRRASISPLTFLFSLCCIVICGSDLQGNDLQNGSVLIAEMKGEVRVLGTDGKSEESKNFKVGANLPVGNWVKTGKGSSVLCLLSNGTLFTIRENSKVRIGTFKQIPFDSKGVVMEKLQSEPSSSEVEIDLDMGSLVVKTKKLNKSSRFDIESPIGTAGIRGTEFQLGYDASSGVELDVTESTVAFAPKGGQPQLISQGKGLSVSITGEVVNRPLNPVVAQQVTAINQQATETTNSVDFEKTGLGSVQQASEAAPSDDQKPKADKADLEKETSGGAPSDDQKPKADKADLEEEKDDAGTSESASGQNEPTGMRPDSSEQSSVASGQNETPQVDPNRVSVPERVSSSVSVPAFENISSSTQTPDSSMVEALNSDDDQDKDQILALLNRENSGNKSQNTSDGSESERSGEGTREGVEVERKVTKSVNTMVNDQSLDTVSSVSVVLENNNKITQVRKTGIVSEFSNEIGSIGLTGEQTVRFESLETDTRKNLLKIKSDGLRELLSNEQLDSDDFDKLAGLSKSVLDEIVVLEDNTQAMLVKMDLDESLLSETILKLAVAKAPEKEISPNDKSFLEVVGNYLEAGDKSSLDRLTDLADRKASNGNELEFEMSLTLLADFEAGVDDPEELFSLADLFANSHFSELEALYKELEMDGLVSGTSGTTYAGSNLIIKQNADALRPLFAEDSTDLIISAIESIEVDGDFEFPETSHHQARIVLMSGEEADFTGTRNISTRNSDLIISTRADLVLDDLQINSGNLLAIRGLRDIDLQDVSLSASESAILKARRDLNVNGLSFNSNLPNILMEATTIRLQNIDFPAVANINLNSLKGPLDGKYPNFGTGVSAAQQIGRVNFIDNVKVGGNLIMDRANFDYFGGNVKIGTIDSP